MRIGTHTTHPAADVFPLLEGAGFDALVADVRERGLLEPIMLSGARVLDGRNRLRACIEARVAPAFREYDGDDPVGFVLSLNLHRRHLNESQRAMVAARVETLGHGGDRTKQAANLHLARADAASKLGVSPRSVASARQVIDRALPEVIAAVDGGGLAVSAAAELAKLPAAQQRDVLERADLARAGNVRALVRQVEKAQLGEQLNAEPPPPPKGPYRVIVADPPWSYGKRSEDTTHRGALTYPDMTTAAICALPVEAMAHDDCCLWLWTTNAFMRDAFAVLDAWGFAEKTILTWVKDRVGLGDWLRGQTEHCILAVRGSPVVTLTNQTTALEAPRREHSRKPDEFYALVEALCPGSKLEMFARESRPGWSAWGAETERFDARGR